MISQTVTSISVVFKSSWITSSTNGHTSILNVRAFLFSTPLLIRSYLLSR